MLYDSLILAEGGAAGGAAGGLMSFMPIILIMIVFMFFMSRGQKKQQQKRQQMLDSIVKGTEVMLSCGIYGKIDSVAEDFFIVEIAPNVKIKIAKAGIAEVIVKEEKAAEMPSVKKEETK